MEADRRKNYSPHSRCRDRWNYKWYCKVPKVSDKDGAVVARRLAREEGLLLGYSCGSAMAGLHQMKDKLTKDDIVVIIFHDHGSRYVGKVYNDEWMRQRGFLDDELQVKDIISF